MPSLRDNAARTALVRRLQGLTPGAAAKWGRLDARTMLCHLNDVLAVAVADTKAQSANQKAFQHFPLKHLILYVLPIPNNVRTAPEFLRSTPAAFEDDRQRVIQLIDRLAAAPKGHGPEHPLFGRLTNEEWNVLQWKHINHHLKQFGC